MKFELLKYMIFAAPLVFLLPRAIKSVATTLVIFAGAIIASLQAVMLITNNSIGSYPDSLSAVFMLAVAISASSAALYGAGYLKGHAKEVSNVRLSIHLASLIVLFFSMISLLSSAASYKFLLWWELMTLSSFMLVIFDLSRKDILHAGVSYLVLMHIGFFFLLAGFAESSDSTLGSGGTISIGCWLLFIIGFGLKAGLFPLHIWLPVAHPAAPSHVSAMMSGVMIKMGVYGIIRATMAISADDLYTAAMILYVAGMITGIFGIYKATVQTDLKRLLAYSSIENSGIITMAVGLGFMGQAIGNGFLMFCGFGGALVHILNHASYKTMLFMGAGNILSTTHTTDMNRLGGLLKKMPLTGTLFLLAMLAICAIPPLSGFFSEFTIFSGMFSGITAGTAPLAGIAGIISLALIGGLSIFAFGKAFGVTFLGTPRDPHIPQPHEVNSVMIAAFAIPLLCITAGSLLFPYLIFGNVATMTGVSDQPVWDGMTDIAIASAVITGIILVLWIIRHALQKGRPVTTAPTWGCAFTAPNAKMQYTANSVSRDLQKTLTGSNDVPSPLIADKVFPENQSEHNEKHDDKVTRLITGYSSRLLHRWTRRLARFQTGKTNHYILHALLFLILVLLLSIINLM